MGGGGGWFFLLLSRRGWRLMFFFPLHLTCVRRKRVSFFRKTFFSLLNGWGRGPWFFFKKYVEGGWEGERVDFFGVGLIHFILTKIN